MRTLAILLLFFLVVTTVIFIGSLSKVHAQITRIASITAPNSQSFYSGIIDRTNLLGYFGTIQSCGQVCKYNLAPNNFGFVKCIAAQSNFGCSQFFTAIIDQKNLLGYFGTYTLSGAVCKYNLSPTNFARVSCISAQTGENLFMSSIIDQTNLLGYFGTRTQPGKVCKYNLAPTNFAYVSCVDGPAGADYFGSAIIDQTNLLGYFGTLTAPARVCKYNLAKTSFALVKCVTAPNSGISTFTSAVIDQANLYGYFGTGSSPAQVVKYNLAKTNFVYVDRAWAEHGVNAFHSAVFDKPNLLGYFGAATTNGKVCKYNLAPNSFGYLGCTATGDDAFRSAVFDQTNLLGYFGTSPSLGSLPGAVVKFALGTTTTAQPPPTTTRATAATTSTPTASRLQQVTTITTATNTQNIWALTKNMNRNEIYSCGADSKANRYVFDAFANPMTLSQPPAALSETDIGCINADSAFNDGTYAYFTCRTKLASAAGGNPSRLTRIRIVDWSYQGYVDLTSSNSGFDNPWGAVQDNISVIIGSMNPAPANKLVRVFLNNWTITPVEYSVLTLSDAGIGRILRGDVDDSKSYAYFATIDYSPPRLIKIGGLSDPSVPFREEKIVQVTNLGTSGFRTIKVVGSYVYVSSFSHLGKFSADTLSFVSSHLYATSGNRNSMLTDNEGKYLFIFASLNPSKIQQFDASSLALIDEQSTNAIWGSGGVSLKNRDFNPSGGLFVWGADAGVLTFWKVQGTSSWTTTTTTTSATTSTSSTSLTDAPTTTTTLASGRYVNVAKYQTNDCNGTVESIVQYSVGSCYAASSSGGYVSFKYTGCSVSLNTGDISYYSDSDCTDEVSTASWSSCDVDNGVFNNCTDTTMTSATSTTTTTPMSTTTPPAVTTSTSTTTTTASELPSATTFSTTTVAVGTTTTSSTTATTTTSSTTTTTTTSSTTTATATSTTTTTTTSTTVDPNQKYPDPFYSLSLDFKPTGLNAAQIFVAVGANQTEIKLAIGNDIALKLSVPIRAVAVTSLSVSLQGVVTVKIQFFLPSSTIAAAVAERNAVLLVDDNMTRAQLTQALTQNTVLSKISLSSSVSWMVETAAVFALPATQMGTVLAIKTDSSTNASPSATTTTNGATNALNNNNNNAAGNNIGSSNSEGSSSSSAAVAALGAIVGVLVLTLAFAVYKYKTAIASSSSPSRNAEGNKINWGEGGAGVDDLAQELTNPTNFGNRFYSNDRQQPIDI